MEPIPRRNPARFFIAGAVVLLVAFVAAALLLFSQLAATASRDTRVDELTANYRAHESEFRAIAGLASVDATFGIDVTSGGVGGASSEDIPRYRDTLRALEAVGAKHVDAWNHALEVTTSYEGLAVSGRDSGYYYSTSSDVETVTLEVARMRDAPRVWYYPLGNGWYATDYRF